MSRNKAAKRRWPPLLAALWLSGAATAEDARDWLREMSAAGQELNYRGTFVYLHQGRMEAMRVIHRAAEGGEHERLVALTGEAREVIRDRQRVTCILPKSKSVMVGRSLPRKPFPAALPRDLGDLADSYEFVVQGEDRIAGRGARIVLIRPRDDFRYGYRLWLDQDSRLLLKSELIDGAGRAVEQMMFTDIEFPQSISEGELQSSLHGEAYTRSGHEQPEAEQARASDWTVAQPPPGFMLTHSNRHALSSPTGQQVEHLVFSDGLATVSVYIEPLPEFAAEATPDAPASSVPMGPSNMGAVNALGLQRDGHQITVVGEVPPGTVERMGASVRRAR